tara:strand:+ start:1456 stop:1626 length:171 start_codon:yes stop_codon:yes gene_type:complete
MGMEIVRLASCSRRPGSCSRSLPIAYSSRHAGPPLLVRQRIAAQTEHDKGGNGLSK